MSFFYLQFTTIYNYFICLFGLKINFYRSIYNNSNKISNLIKKIPRILIVNKDGIKETI
jgi:hypothetical protein